MITKQITIQKEPDSAGISGHLHIEVRDSITGEIKRTYNQKNKIISAADYGVNLIMQHFGGNDTYSLNLSKAKFGTGATAVTGVETDLVTPEATIDRTNSSPSATSIILDFFATDAELPDDTYTEFGVFTDDTRIFTRVLINAPDGFEKSSNEDVIIKYTITITPN